MIQMDTPKANDVVNTLRTDQQGVLVEFIKKDGTIRKMRATLNPSIIPTDKQPKTEQENPTSFGSAIRVFDVEVGEWRSFIWENLTVVNGELV